MEESFRKKLKEYFSFMKKDRSGTIILMVLILIVIAGHYVVEEIIKKPHTDMAGMIKAFEEWERQNAIPANELSFFYFNPNTVTEEQLDSFKLPRFIKSNIISYRRAGGRFKSPADLRKIYGMNDSIFSELEPWLILPDIVTSAPKDAAVTLGRESKVIFDPNSASAEVLSEAGFNNFQTSNLIKFREKGGRFYAPEDIMKIYGVDSGLFLSIQEQILIVDTDEFEKKDRIKLELNSADSIQLVELRGIGPVLAARIIKYRNLLGGFYSVEQIREVYGLPEETYVQLKEKFEADTALLAKIRINFADYISLIRHPYLEKNHVEAILNFRDEHGPFIQDEQLLEKGILDSLSYSRMKPYITCR